MEIQTVELLRLELTLIEPIETSAGIHRARPLVLVRVRGASGEGYGECAALADPTYTEEYADGAEAILATHLIPRLLAGGARYTTAAEGLSRLEAVRGHHMAKAALEMALLDLELRAEQRSLSAHLGATGAFVEAGATVGIGDVASTFTAVDQAIREGYQRVKVKIAPGHDLVVLSALRDAYPDLVLSVDANGAYDISDGEHLGALECLDDLGLMAIEQPLAPDDLVGHARLTRRLFTPIVLDESINSVGSLEVALELHAMDGVSIKAARLGGLAAARAVHNRCVQHGVHLAIGGMFESGIGRAAQLALAALPGFDLPGDLGGSDRYFATDLTESHVVHDGRIPVPVGPGLGVEVRQEVLAACTLRSQVFQAT